MYYVYILENMRRDRYYTGMMKDVQKGLEDHNAGKVKSTQSFKPWTPVHLEKYTTRAEARKRQLYLKSGSEREWRGKILPA